MAATTTSSYGSADDSKSKESTLVSTNSFGWPSGWIEATGNALTNLKNAMNSVKDAFQSKAKELGFDGTEYHPTDSGKVLHLLGGTHYIGLVSLVKPGLLGGYFACVRVLQTTGTAIPITPVLTGFIISARPFLNYVEQGQFVGLGRVSGDAAQPAITQSSNKTKAVTSSNTSGTVSSSNNNDSFPQGWVTAEGDSLKLLIEAMNSVKDSFKSRAKELGLEGDISDYNPTSDGKVLLGIGGQSFIGKIKLSPINILGGYYASVRVSRVVGVAKPQPYELEGFLIDAKPFLHYVEKYEFGFYGEQHWPRGWVDATGKYQIKLLKEAMESVKKDFFIKAKEFGYNPSNEEYYPTDNGILMLLIGGQHFIGLVKLSKPGILGGYYASIAVSRIVGTRDQQPFVLQGFIIDSRPFLRFVEKGVFGWWLYDNDVNNTSIANDTFKTNAFFKLAENSRHLIGNNTPIKVGFNGIGTIHNVTDLTFVQSLVNQAKNEIKDKAGLGSVNLNTFNVISAAVQSFSLRIATFWVKIDIGERFNHPNYIYTTITNNAFGGQSNVTVNNAYTFPI